MERLCIESKCLLSLDLHTRWNSTYLMLDITERFEKVFLRMDFENDSYSSYFMNKENSGGLGSSSGVDFQNFRTFAGFLKFFTMQQRSSPVLCMLLNIPSLMRCL